jgi:hypothetical protein
MSGTVPGHKTRNSLRAAKEKIIKHSNMYSRINCGKKFWKKI